MGTQVKAVIDSGPLIHLAEIGAEKALSLFSLSAPPAVIDETGAPYVHVRVKSTFDRDLAQILQAKFSLGIAESQCIALAKVEKTPIFLTDDLDARTTAKQMGLEPHGTVGILAMAYRKKIFSGKATVQFLRKIKIQSTLYITDEILRFAIREITKR